MVGVGSAARPLYVEAEGWLGGRGSEGGVQGPTRAGRRRDKGKGEGEVEHRGPRRLHFTAARCPQACYSTIVLWRRINSTSGELKQKKLRGDASRNAVDTVWRLWSEQVELY